MGYAIACMALAALFAAFAAPREAFDLACGIGMVACGVAMSHGLK
jgi:predicted RNA methylase